jgi:polyferredoxin
MGNFASRLGPVTAYWILIVVALLLAKVFNWVDIENTMEMLKYVGLITLGYLVLQGIIYLFKSFKK